MKFCLEPFLWNNLCPKNALKLRKLNFEISNSYKNGSRPNFKKVILQFQDNISENISTKFQPSSSKTVGGDRFSKMAAKMAKLAPLSTWQPRKKFFLLKVLFVMSLVMLPSFIILRQKLWKKSMIGGVTLRTCSL